jgi:hypothetical protein
VDDGNQFKLLTIPGGISLHDFLNSGKQFLVLDNAGKSYYYSTPDFNLVNSLSVSAGSRTSCLDPSQVYLTSLSKDNQIEIFDLKAGMTFGRISPSSPIKNCAFLGYDRFSKQLAAISNLGDSYSWDPITQKFIRQLKLQSGEFANSSSIIHSAATNSGGDKFLIGLQEVFIPKGGLQQNRNQPERRNWLLSYDWITGQELKRIPVRYRVDGMALGPGPNHVAYYTNDSKTITLMNLEKGEKSVSVSVDEKPTAISLSDDSQILAVGTVNGTVYLYEVIRNNPADVKITNPPVNRNYGEHIVKSTSLKIEGVIEGDDKISKVFVNGQPAQYDFGKTFSSQVELTKGKNRIRVAIQNTQSVVTEKDFYLTCEPEAGVKENKAISSGKRVALVIGNGTYAAAPKLNNTLNDANSMATVLKELGFDVIKVTDGTYEQIKNAVYTFGDLIQDVDMSVFYYAGHGLEVDGTNYLVPVDANIQSALDVKMKAIPMTGVLRTMEFANTEGLNMIILDACRNNPFPTGKRSSGSGLAQIQPPSGTLIAYATDPGSTASDGDSANGLYTGELVKQLRVSQRIEDIFMNTRNSVEKISKGSQRPWEEARLKGVFYLK